MRPKQLFLSSKRGSGGGGGDHNYNAVFCSNAAELYSSAKAIFIPVNNEEEKTEEDEKEEEEKGRRRRRRKGGGGDLNCNAVFHSNAAELYTHGQGDCFLLSNEQDREEGEKCRGRGGGGRVNKEEEEAMQQSCTHGPWQLFLSSEQ